MSAQHHDHPHQHPQRESEYRGVTIFSPFVVLVEKHAKRRRERVVRRRGAKREQYNTGDPLEIVNADGSVTRVISVVSLPPNHRSVQQSYRSSRTLS